LQYLLPFDLWHLSSGCHYSLVGIIVKFVDGLRDSMQWTRTVC